MAQNLLCEHQLSIKSARLVAEQACINLERAFFPRNVSVDKQACAACRAQLNMHFLELKHKSQGSSFIAGTDGRLGGMTAADSIKLSSYVVAACKTYDQIMIIAHTVIDSTSLQRDNRWTSFVSLSGSQKGD